MQNQVAQSMKNSIKVYLVNSFTRDHCGGNPAGVVLNPPKLTTEQKIAIAQQVGFSETAFVYSGDDTDFKVDFFTAEGEVDFCGHATLAVFSLCHRLSYSNLAIIAKNQGRNFNRYH